MQPRRTRRTFALACSLAAPAVVVATASAAPPSVSTQARFATPADYVANPSGTPAITYDGASVPVGGRARVTQWLNKKGGMSVWLRVKGLRPSTRYDARVNVGACTDDPAAAGARLQNAPSQGSYEANEFRLNFKTDRTGRAGVLTQQYWGIGKRQKANSVVIDQPGTGEPAACVTVPFRRLAPW